MLTRGGSRLRRVLAATGLLVALLALARLAGQPAAFTQPAGLRFPAAGVCHARGRGLWVLPDYRCTPGKLNQAVTPASVRATICRAGWSESVRPPAGVTEPEKLQAIAAYGAYDGRRPRRYELDHLIPLELGGAPNSVANLWPEPDYPSLRAGSYVLNPKDRLENLLRARVCEGRITLGSARRLIAGDWVAAYRRYLQ
jgi:hypothetical protein